MDRLMAPEILIPDLEDDNGARSTASDVYAFAWVAYEVQYTLNFHTSSCSDCITDVLWRNSIWQNERYQIHYGNIETQEANTSGSVK